MSKFTKEDIVRIVREDDVEFIRMQFTDIFGQLKNVAITASQIEKAVNNQIMIDGSSIEGFVRIRGIRPVSTSRSGHLHHPALASAARQGRAADLRRVQSRRHALHRRSPRRAASRDAEEGRGYGL